MTKSELIARLAIRYPQLVAKDAEFAVKMILDAMTASLVSGQRIEIRGFGSFGLNHRPARIGRCGRRLVGGTALRRGSRTDPGLEERDVRSPRLDQRLGGGEVDRPAG